MLDAKTLGLFREQLARHGLIDKLFHLSSAVGDPNPCFSWGRFEDAPLKAMIATMQPVFSLPRH